MAWEHAQNARVFKAFCDENRLRILECLQEGDLCACVLIQRLGIKQPALSYHMKILVEAGVVESKPVGKWTHYRICEEGCAYAQMLLGNLTAVRIHNEEVCQCAKA